MQQYDYIIAGGGLAGLSLAFYLNESPTLRHKKILIIDRTDKTENDRTWCFWTDEKTAFEEIVFKQWQQIRFFGQDFQEEMTISPFFYQMIRGIDFYTFVKNKLRQNPNIEWLFGEVEGILDLEDAATVRVNGADYQAQFVFNSLFEVKNFQREHHRFFYQLQHFKGWIIEAETPVFDPKIMHLMDFRTEQHDNARFFYVLPFDQHSALIEYTIFSDNLLTSQEYDDFLKEYIENTLNIKNYTIKETEQGIIPMTDHPFKKRQSARVLNIGTVGGDVKSSTGYAFLRIQAATRKAVQQLENTGSPFYHIPLFEQRFKIYDTLILGILQREGSWIKPIFTELFRKNKVQRVFGFLTEKTTFSQELKLFYSLPHLPFYKAIFRVYFLKNIKNAMLFLGGKI